MVDTHEMTLSASDYALLTSGNYIILNSIDIEVGDYVLFHEQDNPSSYAMTQINKITQHEGFKDGYALYTFLRLA